MRKLSIFLSLLLTALVSAVSCELKSSELDALKLKMEEIEARIASINDNILSLQSLIKAVSERDCIVDAVPFYEDGWEAGYVIKFRHGEEIVIRNGKNGKDGVNGKDGKDGEDADAPVIGVGQEKENGIWYWTLNGKWIYDDYNNKLMVYGTEAVVPYVKISEGYWYISYDERRTWAKLMEVSDNADSLFTSIVISSDIYYFYLSDGGYITIPKYTPFDVNLPSLEQNVIAGNTATIDFTIVGYDARRSLSVALYCSNGMSANYELTNWIWKENDTYDIKGTITVKVPSDFTSGTLTAFFNDSSNLITKQINCHVK